MSDLDWELLDRYLGGTCTPADRRRFEAWMAEAPENRRQVSGLIRALAAVDGGDAELDFDEAALLASIKRQIAEERRRPHWAAVARIAAAVLVLIGGALAVRAFDGGTDSAPVDVAMRTVTTPRGQRAAFQLPDGTQVILGAASTLARPVDFGGDTREIHLTGEAYFEVTHDKDRPFIVHAGDLVATDLGTEFVIRAYDEDAHARVVVREGEVAVRPATARDTATKRVLTPGQLGRLDAEGAVVVQPADTALHFAWTEGTLAFHDTPLREALPQLGRWYDLEFRLADSGLGALPLSGRFKDRLTDDELDALAASVGLRQVRQGRVVTLERAASSR